MNAEQKIIKKMAELLRLSETLAVSRRGIHRPRICERFYRTIQEEFYAIVFRKELYQSLDELQAISTTGSGKTI